MDFYFSKLITEAFDCRYHNLLVKPMWKTHELSFTTCGIMKVSKFQ